MDFNILEALLYGFISGLTEILPISSIAHQALLVEIFNADANVNFLNFMIHAGVFLALWITCGKQLHRAYTDYQKQRTSRRRTRRQFDLQSIMDFQLIKSILIPLILSFILYAITKTFINPLYWVSIFFLVNGIIMHIPMYIAHGNKDSRGMSRLDGTLIGIGSILSAFPGISRTGTIVSFSLCRGAAPAQALRWSLFLSIPAVAVLMGYDVFAMFSLGMGGIGLPEIIQSLFSAGASFLGTIIAVSIMRILTANANYLNFAYYSYGAALFSFILWLYI